MYGILNHSRALDRSPLGLSKFGCVDFAGATALESHECFFSCRFSAS